MNALLEKLAGPLAVLDLESTGTDHQKDRVIEVGINRYELGKPDREYSILVNPKCPVRESILKMTGIAQYQLDEAEPFTEGIAREIIDLISGCHLAGFKIRTFDALLLEAELWRLGISLPPFLSIIDAEVIFKRKEPRDLAAAYKFYCKGELIDAHQASNDVRATAQVLASMVTHYPDFKDGTATLSEWSVYENAARPLDLAGNLIIDGDGDAAYNFGKFRGLKVRDNIGLLAWMIKESFPRSTKRVCVELQENGGKVKNAN